MLHMDEPAHYSVKILEPAKARLPGLVLLLVSLLAETLPYLSHKNETIIKYQPPFPVGRDEQVKLRSYFSCVNSCVSVVVGCLLKDFGWLQD